MAKQFAKDPVWILLHGAVLTVRVGLAVSDHWGAAGNLAVLETRLKDVPTSSTSVGKGEARPRPSRPTRRHVVARPSAANLAHIGAVTPRQRQLTPLH